MAGYKVLSTTFKVRRGQSSVFTRNNPILQAGEPGYELDTHKLKIGDGSTTWNNLPYIGDIDQFDSLLTQIAALSQKHVEYDELFERLQDIAGVTQDYVDSQDALYFNAIQSIENATIATLFNGN